MATVEELIEQTKLTPYAAFTPDKLCVIDPQTRTIEVPDFLFGVESDEEAERVYFTCPKKVSDTVDLDTMNLWINYENANHEKDSYIVDDYTSSGETASFSWKLERLVTAYRGSVRFIVCARQTDDEGNIIKEWNTTLANAQVLEGLEVENPLPDEDEQSIIDQLLGMMKESAKKAEDAANRAEAAADNVVTWRPDVSEDGDLSWSINDSRTPPETMNIKGPKGDQGEPGVATDLSPGLFGLYVSSEGHLMLTHHDNEPTPPLSIQDGHLIYTID